jgi:hypothetical protein
MRNLFDIEAEAKCLPKGPDGVVIISPKYLPPGSTYLAEWGKWLRSTPKSQWPKWLIADVESMKPGKRTSPGRNSTAASPPSTPPINP